VSAKAEGLDLHFQKSARRSTLTDSVRARLPEIVIGPEIFFGARPSSDKTLTFLKAFVIPGRGIDLVIKPPDNFALCAVTS